MDLSLAIRELDGLAAVGCQHLYSPISHHCPLLPTGIDGADSTVGISDVFRTIGMVLLMLVATATTKEHFNDITCYTRRAGYVKEIIEDCEGIGLGPELYATWSECHILQVHITTLRK